MYNNYPIMNNSNSTYTSEDERFFLAPFLVGGLAGTALGYGIANNNQINNQQYYPIYPVYPMYPTTYYPMYSTSNNYYY